MEPLGRAFGTGGFFSFIEQVLFSGAAAQRGILN